MGINVTFCSARYDFKTCDFTSEVVNINRYIRYIIGHFKDGFAARR